MLEDYAKRNSFPTPTHFTDDGISGIRFDRPGFTAMMEEVEAGRVEVPEDIDYPIMFSSSISAHDRNKIQFQKGHVYKEIPLEGNTVIPGDFRNNGIGWSLNIDKIILELCIV